MGYDLHITRRADWSDSDGPAIGELEWQQTIGGDGEAGAFYWSDGEISIKNPDPMQIAKAVRLAASLNAQVQGDDGEIYREDDSSFQPACPPMKASRQNIFSRIAAWWSTSSNDSSPPFLVGQRVRNPWGQTGTVVHVDRKARGGLGSVRVRLDDGREDDLAYMASGLEIVAD